MRTFKYKINGKDYRVVVSSVEENAAEIEVNGVSYMVDIERPKKAQPASLQHPPKVTAPVAKPQIQSTGSVVKAPLPGTILDVACKVGDHVKKGQQVILLEAMKMENTIIADCDGVVKAINVSVGEAVLEGTKLVVIS